MWSKEDGAKLSHRIGQSDESVAFQEYPCSVVNQRDGRRGVEASDDSHLV